MSEKDKKNEKSYEIRAEDIMSEDVVVIREDTLVKQVAHLMLRNRVYAYPVINEHRNVVGMITLDKFFKIVDKAVKSKQETLYQYVSHFTNMKVSEVMAQAVLTISPETTLEEIVNIIVEKNIKVFPVMHNGVLVGIIGRHDVLNAIFTYG